VHANAFARGGFVVLLYDKRGSGGSGGLLDTSDYEDLAADLGAGIQYLRTRGDVMPGKIGILGRSEGGWVGTLAASNDSSLRFVILSSGSAVRPSTQTLYAIGRAMRERGASVDEVKAGTDATSALWAFYGSIAKMDPSRATYGVTREARDSLEKRLRSFAHFAPLIPQTVRDPAITSRAFFNAFSQKIEYDPLPSFLKGRAALLEVIGSNDEVVDTESTIAAFKGLRRSGRDVTIRTLQGVGHSLVIVTPDGPRYPEDYPEFAVQWARAVIDGIVR
jgi:pimeloyl-ACP methyl ester carboxylesterase